MGWDETLHHLFSRFFRSLNVAESNREDSDHAQADLSFPCLHDQYGPPSCDVAQII